MFGAYYSKCWTEERSVKSLVWCKVGVGVTLYYVYNERDSKCSFNWLLALPNECQRGRVSIGKYCTVEYLPLWMEGFNVRWFVSSLSPIQYVGVLRLAACQIEIPRKKTVEEYCTCTVGVQYVQLQRRRRVT